MSEIATKSASVLLVSREPSALRSVWSASEARAWNLETSASGLEALERIDSGYCPVVILLDLVPGDGEALHTLRWLRRMSPLVPVVVLSEPEDNRQMMEAVRLGAENHILKPCRAEDLIRVLRRYLTHAPGERTLDLGSADFETLGDNHYFVCASPAARRLRARAMLLAQVNVPVLITGESGSGRETTARLIHKLSARAELPFAKVNCAALPSDVLERELWGTKATSHGMMTGELGKFETCRQGTLLLDEVDSLPDHLQVRLLGLFEERHSQQGGDVTKQVGVRIMAATSVDAEVLVSAGQLREDLWQWLSTFVLQVPSVRERRDEIPVLLEHFMRRLSKRYGLPPRPFSTELLTACRQHSWPGNLREMEMFVKRYLVVGDESRARMELRGFQSADPLPDQDAKADDGQRLVVHDGTNGDKPGLKSLLRSIKGEAERNAIARALEETHWNRKAAARLLNISYRALLYKIQHYQMSPPDSYLSDFAFEHRPKGTSHGK